MSNSKFLSEMHARTIEWNESFEDKHLITMNSNWYDLFSLGGIVRQLAEFKARKLRICTHIYPWTREMCNGSLSLSCTIAQCSTGLPKYHRFLPSRRRNCTFARILWSISAHSNDAYDALLREMLVRIRYFLCRSCVFLG